MSSAWVCSMPSPAVPGSERHGDRQGVLALADGALYRAQSVGLDLRQRPSGLYPVSHRCCSSSLRTMLFVCPSESSGRGTVFRASRVGSRRSPGPRVGRAVLRASHGLRLPRGVGLGPPGAGGEGEAGGLGRVSAREVEVDGGGGRREPGRALPSGGRHADAEAQGSRGPSAHDCGGISSARAARSGWTRRRSGATRKR